MHQSRPFGARRKQVSFFQCFQEQCESGCSPISRAVPNAPPAAPRYCFFEVPLMRPKGKPELSRTLGNPLLFFEYLFTLE